MSALSAEFPKITRFLNPGDWAVERGQAVIGTLLGSCVSVTLWSPAHQVGAMCHYMLPQSQQTNLTELEYDARYADFAFELMCQAMRERGIEPRQCQAKLFGGGNMFDMETDWGNLGERNITAGLDLLTHAGINLCACDVGRDGHRLLWFDVASGQVLSRFEPRPNWGSGFLT